MYYIRILGSPKIACVTGRKVRGKESRVADSNVFITCKITIANDLGDIFLDQDILLSVTIVGPECLSIMKSNYTCQWNGRKGMRVLELKVPLPHNVSSKGLILNGKEITRVKLRICAIESGRISSVESFKTVLLGQKTGILSVGTMWIGPSDKDFNFKENTHLMERVLDIWGDKKLHICEETGESIARHLWDAGLVLSACITSILGPNNEQASSTLRQKFLLTKLPIFAHLLLSIKNQPSNSTSQHHFQIIELGAGCGIVSLTLLSCLAMDKNNISAHLTLTDLPIATSILNLNIAVSSTYLCPNLKSNHTRSSITHMVLDWTATLPISITKTKWDLVFVADCTYNPDVIPDLVATLGRIKNQADNISTNMRENQSLKEPLKSKTTVVMALKERHPSEHILFDLMKRDQWLLLEECTVPLSNTICLEEIRILLFV